MRILLITDQEPHSQHSAIRGIFDHYLRELAEVHIVWFSRSSNDIVSDASQTILPWRYRKWSMLWRYKPPLILDQFDFIIVRNLFVVLRGLLAWPERYYKVGFWESFPHTFRRVYEAEKTGQSRFRKRLEYRLRSYQENSLLAACDFYLPITQTFLEYFRPHLKIPTHPLPMGVDIKSLPPIDKDIGSLDEPLRIIYAGAVDGLRDFDLILDAFVASEHEFVLDIYTADNNPVVDWIRQLADPRIRLHKAIPRNELMQCFQQHDLGLALIPEGPLYDVASPTKTIEYYAMGMPALMTPLPEHRRLFGDVQGIFCPLEKKAIGDSLDRLCKIPRVSFRKIGAQGRIKVLEVSSYKNIAMSLFSFLSDSFAGKNKNKP